MSIELRVKCVCCGEELTITETESGKMSWAEAIIYVDPCKSCINEVRGVAYDKGYQEAAAEMRE